MGVENKVDTKQIEEKIFQALGEASMCWSETPKGIFNSKKVSKIGNKLVKELLVDFNNILWEIGADIMRKAGVKGIKTTYKVVK